MIIFWVGQKLHADAIDRTAAALIEASGPRKPKPKRPVRWRPNANKKWRWYERETRIGAKWRLSGITTPVNIETGQPYTEQAGYLDEELVPKLIRQAASLNRVKPADGGAKTSRVFGEGQPPSTWLRNLNSDEIRVWLKTVDVPEVGVENMSYWTHLTRDHSFDPNRIQGLTIEEQAKLHAAAHYGY